MKVEAKKLEVQTSTAPKTGADLLIDLLNKEGVEYVIWVSRWCSTSNL